MKRLQRVLEGPELWVKRDDCTGLAGGGNKSRKLEFLLGEAARQGSNVILTTGGTQSNHVRQTAAISSKLGMRCIAFLEARPARSDHIFKLSGNLLLDRLFGAELREIQPEQNAQAVLSKASELEASLGNRPFSIPAGGSDSIGALGYVECAWEILDQAADLGRPVDWIVLASGTGGTQAGLLVGLESLHASAKVLGFSVDSSQHEQEKKVAKLAVKTMQKIQHDARPSFPKVIANADFVGPGYGLSSREGIRAIRATARMEALLLDPVYSGKAMAGLMAYAKGGFFSEGDVVVFLHTGGTPGLFAYAEDFELTK